LDSTHSTLRASTKPWIETLEGWVDATTVELRRPPRLLDLRRLVLAFLPGSHPQRVVEGKVAGEAGVVGEVGVVVVEGAAMLSPQSPLYRRPLLGISLPPLTRL